MGALILITIALIAYFIYQQLTGIYSYWQKKGIKGPKPVILFGNLKPVWNKEESLYSLCEKISSEFPDEKVVGMYQGLTPTLVVKDAEIIKQVLIKDFASFCDRGVLLTKEPLQKHLFAVEGDDWKTLRQKLTPIFTTEKLRNMMPLLNACVERYMQYLDKKTEENAINEVQALNMKYSMKAITSTVFGVDIDTFVEEKTFLEKMATNLFVPSGFWRLLFFLDNLFPGILSKFDIQVTNTEVAQFFVKLVQELIQEREGKPKVRKDFMDLLIELKEQGTVTRAKDEGKTELEITDLLITANAIVFYAAGYETSSGTMSFLLYELAKNPDIQERCFKEVDAIMKEYNGKLDYDSLKELQYLPMAIDETLRKYPIGAILFRQCVSDYSFKEIDLTIPKGTKIIIPVKGIHNDAKYFPNPEKFHPERFAPENQGSLHDAYMPFGKGPRNCIGLRFAKVSTRLCMAHFVHKFKVSLCEKTPKKIVFDLSQIGLASKNGLYLNIERRT